MKKRSKLSDKDERILISLLTKVEGQMSYKIFREVAKKFVLTPIEAVIFRKHNHQFQILLIKRDQNDPDWGGKLHVPGTILRKRDLDNSQNYDRALKRIEEKEIKVNFYQKPVLVGTYFSKTKRGVENSLIFVCQIEGDPKVGKFYDVNKLPQNIINSQIGFIKLALKETQKKRNLLD